MRPRIIPCILLKSNGLVKTYKFSNPVYVGDPINTVKIFNEKEVDEIVILDITASKEGKKPNYRLIEELASECFMPVAYGGGVRTIDDIKFIFNLGLEKIVINSYAIEDPSFIKKSSERFGSQSIVVSIDVKKNFWGKYEIVASNGFKAQNREPMAFATLMQKMGAGEILLNSIERDGTMSGYDLELIRMIASQLDIPVIASGGAGNLMHFSEALKAGASALAAGSMFVFHGKHRAVLVSYPSPVELDSLF